MKFGVFVCGLIVALAQYSFADEICGYPIGYDTEFVPTCFGNEAVMKWPYYKDFTKFYECFQGVPILMNCTANTYFTYFNQQCLGCNRFKPAPECQYLKTINPPECIPLATTSSTTTTTTTTTTPKPTKPTVPTTSSTSTTSTTTTPTPETVPTPVTVPTPGSGGDIPTPPLIPTSAPGVPTPPVEPPTPPTVEETPEIRP